MGIQPFIFGDVKKKLTREFFGYSEPRNPPRQLYPKIDFSSVTRAKKKDPKIIDKGTDYLIKYLKSKRDYSYTGTVLKA